jgi:hypothetical protein
MLTDLEAMSPEELDDFLIIVHQALGGKTTATYADVC